MRNLQQVDLNLLVALDLLLEEESVTRAAERYGRSTPAMSRMLTRLRELMGDPLLERTGRSLRPTPRARLLKGELRRFLTEARALLGPPAFDPATCSRTFTLQANEDFVSGVSVPLLRVIEAEAPGVSVRFLPEGPEGEAGLRTGRVDMDVSSGAPPDAALTERRLFRERHIGAARIGHPIFAAAIDAAAFASFEHVARSLKAEAFGPVDEALAALGLARRVRVVTPSMRTALAVAAQSDLICVGPSTLVAHLIDEGAALAPFELPVRTPELTVRLRWHPQFDADPEHGWFREIASSILRAQVPENAAELPIRRASGPPAWRAELRA